MDTTELIASITKKIAAAEAAYHVAKNHGAAYEIASRACAMFRAHGEAFPIRHMEEIKALKERAEMLYRGWQHWAASEDSLRTRWDGMVAPSVMPRESLY